MKIIGIYKIQSIKKPKRIYIGSSVNITKRWNHHLQVLRHNKHHSQKLQHHYNKYGEADLVFSIVVGCDKDNIFDVEQFFLDAYKPWFNIYKTARYATGQKVSDETREKHRKSMIGKKWTMEARIRFSEKCKGRPKSEEHKRNLSKAGMGQKHPGRTKEKYPKLRTCKLGNNNPMFGKRPWNKKD
jgi:group I intron endonuclease